MDTAKWTKLVEVVLYIINKKQGIDHYHLFKVLYFPFFSFSFILYCLLITHIIKVIYYYQYTHKTYKYFF